MEKKPFNGSVVVIICAIVIGIAVGYLLFGRVPAEVVERVVVETRVVTVPQGENSESAVNAQKQEPSFVDVSEYMPMISAGQYHSAVVLADGTVVCAGKDTKDRCDVSGWSDIVAVSASSHTVGLRSNGTVVAAGDFLYKCDVSGWSGVIDIDTSEDYTIGLTEDGTVLLAGEKMKNNGSHEVTTWTGITDVAVSAGTAFGLKSNGRVVAAGSDANGQKDVSGWTGIAAISAGRTHVVGLCSDGTVVAAGNNTKGQCNVSGWKDIVAVSAGNEITIGLKKDGTVVWTGESMGMESWQNRKDIVAVSAGQIHALALTADGTVLATGDGSDNKCGVNGANIFNGEASDIRNAVEENKSRVSYSGNKKNETVDMGTSYPISEEDCYTIYKNYFGYEMVNEDTSFADVGYSGQGGNEVIYFDIYRLNENHGGYTIQGTFSVNTNTGLCERSDGVQFYAEDYLP